MYSIIPLAGGDFYNESYGVKPLVEIDGEPLIQRAIKSRSWYKNGETDFEHTIFVLRETEHTEGFRDYIKENFPKSKIVTISQLSGGALMSALAGASMITDYNAAVVVDLVDIIYDSSSFSPTDIFMNDPSVGGVLPYFNSDNEKYSYIEISGGYALQVAEKRVISNNASAGTYFFKNISVFLSSVMESVSFDKLYSYKDILFLAPAFNAVVRNGMRVLPVEVKDVNPVSIYLK